MYTIWPDEYIFIEINSEYLKTAIEPILTTDKSDEYSQGLELADLIE